MINVEDILYSYYIKYDKLFEMNNDPVFQYVTSNTITYYIDLYGITHRLYEEDHLRINHKFSVVSGVINLVAHLRGYYWTRHRVNTIFFLVYGSEESNNRNQFYPVGDFTYRNRKDFLAKKKYIDEQLDLLKILCVYINKVYYIRKSTDFSMFVMQNQTTALYSKLPAFILSRSKMAYQLPAINSNTVIFRPKKSKMDGDQSFIVSKYNSNRLFFDKVTKPEQIQQLNNIHPMLLSIMMVLNGTPDYKIRSCMNITTMIKLMTEAIVNYRIINDYNSDPEFVYDNFNPSIHNYITKDEFVNRFKALDNLYQYRIYLNTPEAHDFSWNVDLSDPKTLHDINNTYFVDNSLDLLNL